MTTSRPKGAGQTQPAAHADTAAMLQLRATAALIRDAGARITVDPSALADLLEHTATCWTVSDHAHPEMQWPWTRRLIAALAGIEVQP